MLVLVYNLFLHIYYVSANMYALFNKKAKLWIDGRKDIFAIIASKIGNNKTSIIWIHCASLGEFEQGLPIIKAIKKANNSLKICVTFFSPSGYETCKNNELIDFCFYLPLDSNENAKQFLNLVQPKLAIFIKYDLWWHYLNNIKQQNIPCILVSARFTKKQIFFKWYGGLHKAMLQCFTTIFVQDTQSQNLLSTIAIKTNVFVAGDTRFDRVIEIANTQFYHKEIEAFIGNNPCFIAGSTWPEDEQELGYFINKNTHLKSIVAPHQIDKQSLADCLQMFHKSTLLSELTIENCNNFSCVIVDNIGMLSKLYRYATICYIGGGFGYDGVHNVLEPAVYGKPIIFGNEYEKFLEAIDLVDIEAAFAIENYLELNEQANKLLSNKTLYNEASNKAKTYVANNKGATSKIVDLINKF
jgi:3-deoxy-D-manno-octulosonic-acid transferase